MTKQVQLRRGTTVEHSTFTGAVGELTVDIDKDVAVVHDGVTVGGHELVGVAATSQSIVNKDGVGIGTTNARSPLTVIGDSFISGVSTFAPGVGSGSTVVYVEGNARVTGTLSVGSSTIVINGDTNTISVETISVNRIDISGYGVTVFSLDTNTRGNISAGSSVISIRNVDDLVIGDFISIPSYLESTIISGIGITSTDVEFNQEILSTLVSQEVGIGNTAIPVPLNSTAGVSIGNSVTISDQLINVPIVGLSSVSIGSTNAVVLETTVTSSTLISDTIIAIGSSSNISIGDSFSSGVVQSIPIIGITTATIDPYQSLVLTTDSIQNAGVGTDIISVTETTGITTGNIVNIITALGGNITGVGTDYTEGVYNSVLLVNEPLDTFIVTTVSNPGTPPPDNVFVIDGVTQDTLTLVIGNTYRFDISDVSNATHPLIFQTTGGDSLSTADYVVVQKGTEGTSGAFVDLIIKPSATPSTIKYNCSVHDGMGANITITTGSAGNYGSGVLVTVTVNASTEVSDVAIENSGIDYKANDVLQAFTGNIGGTGSGFEFTVLVGSGVSISNTVAGFDENTITVGSATTVYIPSGSSVNVSEIRTDGPAVELGTAVGAALTAGAAVQITQLTPTILDTILIGTENVLSEIIPTGSVVSISTVTTVSPAVIIEGVTSDIIPDNSAARIVRIEEVANDLVVDTLATGNLNVTGIATIATVDINAGQIDVTRIGSEYLNVTGVTTLGGYVDINAPVDISGDVTVAGLTTFSDNVHIDASADISSNLNVVGLTTLSDYVDINASVGISSGLSVAGLTTLSGYVDINDSLGIGVDLTVNSDVVIGGNVDIDDYVDINGDLNVAGLTTVGGYLEVNDSVGISSNISVAGIATIAGLTYPPIDGLNGQVIRTDGQGNLTIGPVTGGGGDLAIIVSASDGDDENDGVNLPVKTIKRASQLASFIGQPATIFVESGDYVEENPIILYDEISIVGDSLRNVVVRPAQSGKDLFRVRNGCYLTNMTFNDFVDGVTKVPQHTWNYSIAFDDPYDSSTDRTGYACTGTRDVVGATFDPNTGLTEITTATPHELYRGTTARVLGIGWTCGYDESGISTVRYTAASGITTVTTFNDRNYSIGTKVFLHNLPFSIVGGGTTIFPDDNSEYGRVITVTGVNTAAKTFTFLAGISTVLNSFQGWPEVGISTFVYTNSTGISTATTNSAHGFEVGDKVTLADLRFSCASEHVGVTTTVFPDGTSLTATPDGYTFTVIGVTTDTFTFNAGISTIAHNYVSDGYAKKVPTTQRVVFYPDSNPDGKIDFGVVAKIGITTFMVRTATETNIPHFYTLGGTVNVTKPKINKSPYIQNCSILSSIGGNGILVDGDKIIDSNRALIPELGEIPVEGAQPQFGKSMVAATFTMISFGGIGWRTINDGYAQVVSCFQIFCRYGSLCQSGGYLSITNSATNFGSFALRATGFSRNSFLFDRGRVVATGTQDGLQTLRVIGLGRSDQQLYVLRFLNNSGGDDTALFKPLVQTQEFTGSVIDVNTNTFTIGGHPFQNLDSVIYSGVENQDPSGIPSGILNEGVYYVQYIDASQFRLFLDEGLQTVVSLGSTFVGINTITRNNQEFFVSEIIDSHQVYQQISFASTAVTPQFVSGREVIQTVIGGNAVGYAVTYNQSLNQLIVSTESVGGIRNLFSASGNPISDHSPSPVSIGVTEVVGINTYTTINFKLDSTVAGNVLVGISSLTESYRCHFHRPSIVNSSAHTWEFSGSGTDYNALPENGGKGDPATEQVFEQGGRVFASGTNELGDFKIGSQITAFNRTGNIVFNNKVSIGELDSIRLSLSGGVSIEEFSTSVQLGEDEVGGPRNKRVPTQLAVRSFLGNRLGTFIDKSVSANAVPNAVVQLNSNGQINADLIPPRVVAFVQTPVAAGRTVLVNRIPAVNIAQGDTIVEPEDSYVLINDTVSQYLVLDNGATNFVFANGQEVVSALSDSTVGVVTAPPQGIGIGSTVAPYVGYGTTGLVKGVGLNLNLTVAGSGYLTPGVYEAVPASTITGTGTGALITVTIGAGGNVTNVALVAGGKGYANGNIISVNNPALIGGRSGGANFQATISSNETRLYLVLTNNQKFAGSSALPDFIQDGTAVAISTSLTTEYFEDFNPTDVGISGDVDFSAGSLIVGSNQFADGDPIIYDSLGGDMLAAAGAGLIDRDTYYIKLVGAGTSVELHRNYQLNNKVVFTGSGSGTHRLRRAVVNIQKDTVVFVNHPFETGTPVRASGATPTGIATGQFLYCGSVTDNSFTFHETQFDAISSVNGVTFNAIAIGGTHTGTFTLTEQNVRYQKTVNTSSSVVDNWSLVAAGTVDAANIVSGIIAPTRLGLGTANSDTVLTGTSEYVKAVFSVGIGTTQPMTVTSQNTVFPPGGVGVTTHFGNVNIALNRVQAASLDTFSTLGVARFKTSTFEVGTDGAVSIRSSATGDVDAATLGGVGGGFYLDTANHIGSVPISRGGTGQTGAPANGAILIGNGSAYNLTNTPTFTGRVLFNAGLVVSGIATATRFTSTQATGTAPFTVTSTTQVNNLNANFLGGTTRAALQLAISQARTLGYFSGVS